MSYLERLSKDELYSLMYEPGELRARREVEFRGYQAIYYHIQLEHEGSSTCLYTVGPYKCAWINSPYYDSDVAKRENAGAKAERDIVLEEFRNARGVC